MRKHGGWGLLWLVKADQSEQAGLFFFSEKGLKETGSKTCVYKVLRHRVLQQWTL